LSESTQGDNPTQVTNDSEFTDNNFTVEEAYKHDFIRVSVYNTCDTQKPVYSEIYNLKSRPDLICLSEGTDFNINGDPEKDITGGDFPVMLLYSGRQRQEFGLPG